jgi:hypothetical protein
VEQLKIVVAIQSIAPSLIGGERSHVHGEGRVQRLH